MFCKNCGKEIGDNERFCRYCGNMVNNMKVSDYQPCMRCGGKGETRSTVKFILGIISVFLLLGSLVNLAAISYLLGDGAGFLLIFIFAGIGFFLYWCFKKNLCPVCHGSGRLHR